jgi:hypothetical protein
MSKSLISGGSAAGGGAANLHKQKSSELIVSVEKKNPTDTCSASLQYLCISKAPSILGIDEENGKKAIKLTLTFSNSEEAAEAKKRLKNLEIKMSSKDNEYTRKISVESPKPKKYDPSSAPAPSLPLFDPQCLTRLELDPIDPADKRPPKWLIDSVRYILFSSIDVVPSVEYTDMTPVNYYLNRVDISFIRIPHPGNPSLAKECVEMTGKGDGVNRFNYQFLKVTRIPTAILDMPECWTR